MNKLDLHTVSIGLSLQSPISIDDNCRRDQWMIRHTRELFALAKLGIIARDAEIEANRKASLRCDECASTGDHATADCPFPARHVPLFPEMEAK